MKKKLHYLIALLLATFGLLTMFLSASVIFDLFGIRAKEGNYVTVRLPSKEIRFIRKECFGTIGEVSNNDAFLVQSGKAGRTRWLGKRPTVRGSVMNACDHPHGGGEGRTPIGRTRPLTPWGKPALGKKTRKTKKLSNAYILRRRS